MPIAWNLTVIIVSYACWRIRGKSCTNASNRSDIYPVSLFWKSTNESIHTKHSRDPGKPQTNATPYAADEIRSHLSTAAIEPAGQGTSQIPLFTARFGDRTSQSGLGYRYYLSSFNGRFCLSGSFYRLVQPVRFIVRSFNGAGLSILSFCVSKSITIWKAGNSQFRSRRTIYLQRLYRCSTTRRNSTQHGWERTGIGQCFYRKAMENCKIRKCLYQRLPISQGSRYRLERLFQFLQLFETTCFSKRQNSFRNLWCKVKVNCLLDTPGVVGGKIPPHPP